MRLRITINIRGLQAMSEALAGGALRGSEMDDLRKKWSTRYSAFVRRRFDRLSQSGGGGAWPPLALSTIKARRGPDRTRAARRAKNGIRITTNARDTQRGSKLVKVAGRAVSILRDTGVLYRALTIGALGNLNEPTRAGIEFGFAPVAHPPRKGSKRSKSTIAAIASYHDAGGKHLPKRQILVRPDPSTGDAMAKDLRDTLILIGKRAQQ